MVTFEVLGRPCVYRPPRVTRRHGTYSPHTKKKQEVQWVLKSQFNTPAWESAIHLRLMFYFAVPKHTSNVKKQQMLDGTLSFCKRPDLSNCIKFIEDCGNGVLWKDDSQIIKLEAQKLYGTKEKTLIMMSEVSLWDA